MRCCVRIEVLIRFSMSFVTVKMTKVLGHWKLFSSDDKWDEYMRTLGKSQLYFASNKFTLCKSQFQQCMHKLNSVRIFYMYHVVVVSASDRSPGKFCLQPF